jgi:gamma-glutamylcyclotransferase (GGCT)/AIG2-like uncharacterized protein YtfP
LGEVQTVDEYPMFLLGETFPYLLNKPSIGHIITGELYEINDIIEGKLDIFEGVPYLYKKGYIDVVYKDKIVKAKCYFKSTNVELPAELLSNF